MPDEPVIPVEYVAGFLFSTDLTRVVLIEKLLPVNQRGLLNAVGGKIEKDEDPLDAMRREFKEETNLAVDAWFPVCILRGQWGRVFFYYATRDYPERVESVTDEPVAVYSVGELETDQVLPNVPWLLEMALSRATGREKAHGFIVTEI